MDKKDVTQAYSKIQRKLEKKMRKNITEHNGTTLNHDKHNERRIQDFVVNFVDVTQTVRV